MATMTRDDALNLYSILDKNIGVFRQEDMPDKAVKFHESKKEDFIHKFTTEVPENYWFQGVELHSVTLALDLEHGFTVIPEVMPHASLKPLVETTNRKIREANLVIKV